MLAMASYWTLIIVAAVVTLGILVYIKLGPS
jgi:hypothetical protein